MYRLQNSRQVWTSVLTAVFAGTMVGCNGFLDPAEMGSYPDRHHPLRVNILNQLDTGIEEPNPEFANASNVRPEDLLPMSGDYRLGPNDLVSVSISDLVAPQLESVKNVRITDSGKISLPLVGQVQAAGLTEAQLEAAISQAYRDAGLIQRAQVSVTTLESRNRVFSILGSVNMAGQYQILQSDFRLMDALVYAKDINSPTGVDTIYIVRRTDLNPAGEGAAQQPNANAPATRPTNTDVLTPRSRANESKDGEQLAVRSDSTHALTMKTEQPAGEPASQPSGDQEGRMITIEGREVPANPGAQPTAPGDQPAARPNQPMDGAQQPAGNFEFNAPQESSNVRVIRIPLDELRTNGRYGRYNVVIRPQDLIWVPPPQIGVYYMGGHVQRTGVYSLTAQKISLKQAIIAAGMLDQLAVPQRTQIVRRIRGKDQEIFATVDLAKIFAGEDPDIYLKPEDQVMVGTTVWAPFLAAVRNGFRITYGFGFLYDRNYYDDNNNNN